MCSMFPCLHVNKGRNFTPSTIHQSNQENEQFWLARSLQVSLLDQLDSSWFHRWTLASSLKCVSHVWNQLPWCLWSKQITCRLMVGMTRGPSLMLDAVFFFAAHFVRDVQVSAAVASRQKISPDFLIRLGEVKSGPQPAAFTPLQAVKYTIGWCFVPLTG